MVIVYLIQNLCNGKCYVGRTTRSLKTRWYEHCSLFSKKRVSALSSVIQEYGKKSFSICEIERVGTLGVANKREEYWIKTIGTMFPLGYNITEGGENKPLPEAIRKKIGAKHKGKRLTEEHKAQLSRIGLSRVTEETRRISRERMLGKKRSPETKAKIRVWNLGRVHSEEARMKMSEKKKEYWAKKTGYEFTSKMISLKKLDF